MLLYTSLAALVVIFAIFLAPQRHKVWVATGVISTAAIAAITLAVMALNDGVVELGSFSTIFFGNESLSVDPLSSLFLIIIALASVATVIYSRGYVA
ncbi:MAG: NADH-quinone oxidoreductase subunit E, partial [Alistipes sp.]|nr:NADH-quinone oxidoreductase subunit E [Alistipes sp.]